MKKEIYSFLFFLIPLFLSAQDPENYYQLTAGGEKFKKPVRYVLFNGNEKSIDEKSKEITFFLDSEIFKHRKVHCVDTIPLSKINKEFIRNIKCLKKDEFQEHRERTTEENIDMPPPFDHYNLKVFILEPYLEDMAIKYEVEWIFGIP